MTKIIAEIDDVGQMIIKDTGSKREQSKAYTDKPIHAWDWFAQKRLSAPELSDGRIDWNWMVNTINEDFNNEKIRAFVWGKFLEEYGEDMLI